MKKQLSVLLGLAVLSTSAIADVTAQDTSTTELTPVISTTTTAPHRGIKLGLKTVQGKMDFVLDINISGQTYTRTFDENITGKTLTAGYQRITSNKWGFSVLVNHTDYKNEEGDDFLLYTEVEGNATYAFTENFYTAFGGSLGKYTANFGDGDTDFYDELGVVIGTQVSLGYQIIDNVSAELKFAYNTASYESSEFDEDDFEATVSTTTTHLGLNATF